MQPHMSYLISSQSRLRHGRCCGVGSSLCIRLSTTTSRYKITTQHNEAYPLNTRFWHIVNTSSEHNTVSQTVLHHIHVTYISISVIRQYPFNSLFRTLFPTSCSCQQSAVYLGNSCKLTILRASPSSNA